MSTIPLPDDVVEAVRAMRATKDPRLDPYLIVIRRQNWSLNDIAVAMGTSRQAISNRIRRYLSENDEPAGGGKMPGLPKVPYVRRVRTRVGMVRASDRLQIDTPTVALLLGSWLMSSRVRNNTPEGHPNREAADIFDREVVRLVRDGVPLVQISRELGIDDRAMRMRLSRHGITAAEVKAS